MWRDFALDHRQWHGIIKEKYWHTWQWQLRIGDRSRFCLSSIYETRNIAGRSSKSFESRQAQLNKRKGEEEGESEPVRRQSKSTGRWPKGKHWFKNGETWRIAAKREARDGCDIKIIIGLLTVLIYRILTENSYASPWRPFKSRVVLTYLDRWVQHPFLSIKERKVWPTCCSD